jgi:hypothetical protein
MGHVAKTIGGLYTTPNMTEEAGVVVEFVSKAKQKEAMQFLQEQLFKTPKWLIDNNISDYTGDNKLTIVGNLQTSVLNRLISNNTLNKLFRFEAEDASNAYTATEMMSELRRGIWGELATRQSIDIYRRGLQKTYLETMIKLIAPEAPNEQPTGRFGGNSTPTINPKTTDAISIAKAQLRQLQADIRAALPAYKDAASKAHLMDVLDRISETLNPNK